MTDHHDVLIIGAGLSGIGAACHLQAKCPTKSFAILEAREQMGGTWDLFRYPGIRSDSDMFTLGYSFKPWKAAKAIADGPAIREYIHETARENDVEEHIRYGHKVSRAEWSSDEARWTVTVETAAGTEEMTSGFLFWCSGYYRYDEGFTPPLPGKERFGGELIHPQHWPEDLDYSGKRVVVIGSGATAVTLIPAMAETAEHVTMLQRSPSYVISLPAKDPVADVLRKRLPAKTAYAIVRWKNVLLTTLSYQVSRRRPEWMKKVIRFGLRRELPKGYDIDKHFRPRYEPWDQRLCLVPNGDLFRAIRKGRASVVTDRIKTFTEEGIELESGTTLEADVIVTATGLNLQLFGGAELAVDGRDVDPADTVAYKGMMFSGLPNLAIALGYTNASWTLKCDLVCEYVCRLLTYMDEHGHTHATPLAPPAGEPLSPVVDLEAGYVLRSVATLPKQGARPPWRLHQNYVKDIRMFRGSPLADEGIAFSTAGAGRQGAPPVRVTRR